MAEGVIAITDDNHDAEIIDSGSPALLDFYSTWCAPCKTIARVVEELAQEYEGQGLKVGKVDITEAPQLVDKYSIRGVPTLIFFKGGQPVDQLVGAFPRAEIEKRVKTLL